MRDLPDSTAAIEKRTTATPQWPIFICYRQDDGKDAARWLAERLNHRPLPFVPEGYETEPELDVYFDEIAPAVADWTKIHGPALERSRALLLVCSPGAFADFGENDWVQREIRWWLEHRSSAPVVIDSTGSEDRWVPQAVKDRWPQAQRTKVLPLEWSRLPVEDREAQEARVLERILGGIRASEITVRYEDLERERELTKRLAGQSARLRRQRGWLIGAAAAAVISAAIAISFASSAAKNAAVAQQNAQAAAEASQRAEKTNRELRDTLVWVFNEAAHFEVDRAGLSSQVQPLITGFAQRLRQTGYDGSVTLEGHIARFCVTDAESPEEAPPTMPFSRCEFYPQTAEYMLALGERLAVSMRDALLSAGFPRDKVRTVSYGAEFPQLESPERPKTAGEWNRIARQNNKVHLLLTSP